MTNNSKSRNRTNSNRKFRALLLERLQPREVFDGCGMTMPLFGYEQEEIIYGGPDIMQVSEEIIYGGTGPDFVPVSEVVAETQENLTARIEASATREDGTPISSIRKGDEFWVDIGVQDTRKTAEGVFSAYFDVRFDRQAFDVLEIEPANRYRVLFLGSVVEEGIDSLGGTSDSIVPFGPGFNSIVRFKLKALYEGKGLSVRIDPTDDHAYGLLVYGEDTPVPLANIASSELRVDAGAVGRGNADVNCDGIESPLDVLLIINHLNRQPERAVAGVAAVQSSDVERLDVDADGTVSLSDVAFLLERLETKTRMHDYMPGEVLAKRKPFREGEEALVVGLGTDGPLTKAI